MEAREVRTAEDAVRLIEERGLSHVKVAVFDVDGILRGKYMSAAKFTSSLKKGFGFCDVVLGWDMHDALYDNVTYTGWHTGYPDAPVRILPETCRELPFESTVLFLAEFTHAAEAICPRGVLRRTIEKAHSMGFEPFGGLEYEFFIFNETPDSVREKGYRDLEPLAPGSFGYSMIRNTVFSELYTEMLELSESMDFPIEGLHEETGPGVMEAALTATTALEAADQAGLFKTFAKVLCQRNGLMATFMAKWSNDWPGQSGHIHISLLNKHDLSSAMHDATKELTQSNVGRHFLAGCQRLMPEMLALVSPTVNSYSRLVPGAWAPTASLWGVENRTCALRVIPGGPKSQRVEYRIGAADGNPYLGLAAVIASGLAGIENEWEPTPQIIGNAYEQPVPPGYELPTTLWDAAQRLKASSVARETFGDAFVDHFAATREWEERQFRKAITDWELKRYFEII
jgi:glutamine synthetase